MTALILVQTPDSIAYNRSHNAVKMYRNQLRRLRRAIKRARARHAEVNIYAADIARMESQLPAYTKRLADAEAAHADLRQSFEA